MLFFTDKTGVRISPTELVEFFEEMEQDFLKKEHEKFEFGKTIYYALGCNTIRWTKIVC